MTRGKRRLMVSTYSRFLEKGIKKIPDSIARDFFEISSYLENADVEELKEYCEYKQNAQYNWSKVTYCEVHVLLHK